MYFHRYPCELIKKVSFLKEGAYNKYKKRVKSINLKEFKAFYANLPYIIKISSTIPL